MSTTIEIKKVSFYTLIEKAKTKEALVLLGAGGDMVEWIEGVTTMLHKEGITTSIDPTVTWSGFATLTSTGGRSDLVLFFPEDMSTLNAGKLAMWRLRFGDASWLSDFVVNYRKHYL